MPKFNNYYIVEYRYAIRVDDVGTVTEAVSIANRICERQMGFKPDNWHARIFEYSIDSKEPGVFKEFFFNPYSASVREITKNIGYHNDLVSKGEMPPDIIEANNILLEEEDNV